MSYKVIYNELQYELQWATISYNDPPGKDRTWGPKKKVSFAAMSKNEDMKKTEKDQGPDSWKAD